MFDRGRSVGSAPGLHVTVDHELCNGVGLCAETAPEVFELREDAKSWVRDLASSEISDERLSEARDLCPWMAISVERPVSDQPETDPTA